MSNSINLRHVLRIWEKEYLKPESLWPHLADEELDFSALGDSDRRDQVVDHLARCRFCSERLRAQQNLTAAAPEASLWDLAVLKAAAGEKPVYPLTWYSEKKYYKIEVMQNSAGGEDGLAVLTLLDPGMAARHEGAALWVCDAAGKIVLRGIVVNGEVWQKIPSLDDYDYSQLLVYVTGDLESNPLND